MAIILSSVLLVAFSLCPCEAQGPSSSTGVPCYLQPAGDKCHYELKPGSESCTSVSDKKRLTKNILQVNRTLVSLEHQLIRLGIIPPDDTCSELPPVTNGGVVYSDLHLGPGTIGRYTCNAGYTLQPLADRYEFSCTIDGVWDGDVIEVPVKCFLSSGQCDPPDDILNGTITYTGDDPSHVFVGDVISYSCDPGNELVGPSERYCQRNESWSGPEPQCNVSVAEAAGIVQEPTTQSHFHKYMVIGFSVGSAIASVVIIIMLAMIILACYKCISHFKNKPGNGSNTTLEIRDDNRSGTPYRMYRDSPSSLPPSKKKKKKSSSKPTTLTVESTAL